MRQLILLLVFGLIAAACGGAETSSDPTEAPTAVAAESEGSDTDDASATEEPTAAEAPSADEASPTAPSFDGPPAPDFDLVLADGSTFNLVGEQKPTYIVFWAEW